MDIIFTKPYVYFTFVLSGFAWYGLSKFMTWGDKKFMKGKD